MYPSKTGLKNNKGLTWVLLLTWLFIYSL